MTISSTRPWKQENARKGATQADKQSREDQHNSGEQRETAQRISCTEKQKRLSEGRNDEA
jgi:hypothetical protein